MTTSTAIQKSFCTTYEAARLLGVSLRTVQLWAENGLLTCWRTAGGHRRIPRASIERLLLSKVSELPVAVPQDAPKDEPAAVLRVLAVEDDPTTLRLYRVMLGRWALAPEVTTATNGFEALVRLGSIRPHLLITDLSMPEMDGFKMVRTLRGMPELDEMEIVVVSGLETDAIRQSGGLPAGIPVLPKPVPFAELERIALAVAANQRRPASPMA